MDPVKCDVNECAIEIMQLQSWNIQNVLFGLNIKLTENYNSVFKKKYTETQ